MVRRRRSYALTRFGFVYNTTAVHVEQGQERFVIDFDPESESVYLIDGSIPSEAFSGPPRLPFFASDAASIRKRFTRAEPGDGSRYTLRQMNSKVQFRREILTAISRLARSEPSRGCCGKVLGWHNCCKRAEARSDSFWNMLAASQIKSVADCSQGAMA